MRFYNHLELKVVQFKVSKSLLQWLHRPRGRYATAGSLGLPVQIPPRAMMSVCCVVCSQVEVSASGRSLVQRSPTECCVSQYDFEAPQIN